MNFTILPLQGIQWEIDAKLVPIKVSFLQKRGYFSTGGKAREQSANPAKFRSQQVRSGWEKKAFWCCAGFPLSP